jgi:hypothetical protein
VITHDKNFTINFLGPLYCQELYNAIPSHDVYYRLDSYFKKSAVSYSHLTDITHLYYKLKLIYEHIKLAPYSEQLTRVKSAYFKTMLSADLVMDDFSDKEEMSKEFNEFRTQVLSEEDFYSNIVAFTNYLSAAGDIQKAEEIIELIQSDNIAHPKKTLLLSNYAGFSLSACHLILSRTLLENNELERSLKYFFMVPQPLSYRIEYKNQAYDLIETLLAKNMRENAVKVFHALYDISSTTFDENQIFQRAKKLMAASQKPSKGKPKKGGNRRGRR